jgi:hypothetical protein
MVAWSSYPSGDLIAAGLSDLADGRVTVESLLVSVGAYRLRDSGLEVVNPIPDAERRLYDLLAEKNADAAHGEYNALIRRLVSFERALECARP